MPLLFGEADSSGLADNGDLHLTRIGHLVLNSFGYFSRQFLCLGIVDLIGSDNDAQLAAGLNSVGLEHSGIAQSKLFEIVQTLDIGFNNLSAGARTGA